MPTTIVSRNRHYYEDIGSGEALVMIHGASGSSRNFEEQFEQLSKRFRVIAPDLRSMGQSGHVKDMPATAWVDDLRELLDQLGVTSVHLVGSSLGSRVAMRYTIDHPEQVRSIAVINPIIAITPEATARLNAAGGDANKLAAAQQTEMERLHGVDWRDVVLNYFNIRNNSDVQSFFDLSGLVDQIAVPMLIVRTVNVTDLTHPFLHTYELRNRVENSHMAIVPNFGASQIRVAPDKLNELIFDFHEKLMPVPAA